MKNKNKSLLEKVRSLLSDDEVKLATFTVGDVTYEAEALTVDNVLFIVGEEGNAPAPAGNYEIDGNVITVGEEGVITVVEPVELGDDPDPEKDTELAELIETVTTLGENYTALQTQHVELAQSVTDLSEVITELVDAIASGKAKEKETEFEETETETELEKQDDVKLNENPNRELLTARDRVFDRLYG